MREGGKERERAIEKERAMSATAVLTGLCPPLNVEGASYSAVPQLQVQLLCCVSVQYVILYSLRSAASKLQYSLVNPLINLCFYYTFNLPRLCATS